jgi:3-methyladenine DNA glycosylase AlkC
MENEDIIPEENFQAPPPVDSIPVTTKLPDSDTAFSDIMGKLNNPENQLSVSDRMTVRNIAGDVESAVKSSLVELMMGQFSKISAYDAVAGAVMKQLVDRAPLMDTEELLNFLNIVSSTSSKEAKAILDQFKKAENDIRIIFKEQSQKVVDEQKMEQQILNVEGKEVKKNTFSGEQKEKMLKLIRKVKGN